MNLQAFIDWQNGDYCDFDKNKRYWCVDLMRTYIQEVLNMSGWIIPATDYAKNIFKRFPDCGTQEFIKIYNQKDNYPKAGDIVIWGWKWPTTGYAGHVAICTGGDVNQFISLDQNYPTGKPCRYTTHTYRGVLGWLRPIPQK